MKRNSLISIFVISLLLSTAAISTAGVSVNVNIGPPPVYTFSEPPELVVIPNTYAYYAPGADVDIVFYGGFWYRPYNGYWFRSSVYNGPWVSIGIQKVPRYIINLPPNYRALYRDYPRIPYGYVNDNWKRWEKERYWNKKQWKHERDEWKQERRQDRREHRQEMRQDRQEHRDDRKDRRKERRENKRDTR